MRYDYESTDEASAAKLAADEAMPDPPPDPSEYEEPPLVCATCGEPFRAGHLCVARCPRCRESMEYDRLERESNR